MSSKILSVLIALATILVYAGSVGNEFIAMDDAPLIYKNTAIQGFTFHNIKQVFSMYDPELYVPLTFVSYMTEHFFFGLNPTGYHVTNILIQILNASLVFLIISRLTKSQWIGFFTGLIFAIHPLNTETVVWASARKDLLSSFFFLGSILLYLKHKDDDEKYWYYASIATFALGLLSKVSIIALPIVLILIDLLHKRKLTDVKMYIEKLPYFALSVTFGIVAIFGKSSLLSMTTTWEKMLLAGKSTLFYLQKLFIPTGLSIVYPQNTEVTITSPEFAVPFALISLFTLITLLAFRFSKPLFVAGSFYLLMLIPSYSTFAKNGAIFFASDRYPYLASISIITVVLSALYTLWKHDAQKVKVLTGAMSVVVIALGWTAQQQSKVWADDGPLYEHVISLYPESALAQNNLGSHFFELEDYGRAMVHYQKALDVNPGYTETWINMGNIALKKDDFTSALDMFQKGINVIPEPPMMQQEDLIPYYFLAETYLTLGKQDDAIKAYEEAAERGATFAEPHLNLALTYHKYDRIPEAIEHYKKALEINNSFVDAHYNLAALYGETGRLEDSMERLEDVIRFDPDNEKAREHLENMKKMIQ